MRGRYLFGHGGGKPEGKEGEIKITREKRSIFKASLSTPKPLHPQEGVCHSHVRGRQLIFFYEYAEHSERASPESVFMAGGCVKVPKSARRRT